MESSRGIKQAIFVSLIGSLVLSISIVNGDIMRRGDPSPNPQQMGEYLGKPPIAEYIDIPKKVDIRMDCRGNVTKIQNLTDKNFLYEPLAVGDFRLTLGPNAVVEFSGSYGRVISGYIIQKSIRFSPDLVVNLTDQDVYIDTLQDVYIDTLVGRGVLGPQSTVTADGRVIGGYVIMKGREINDPSIYVGKPSIERPPSYDSFARGSLMTDAQKKACPCWSVPDDMMRSEQSRHPQRIIRKDGCL